MSDDAIIQHFEPLRRHCPRNTKILTTLAEAYARKRMFDKSLSLYECAQLIAGGKRTDLDQAMAETKLNQMDFELSQLDPPAADFVGQREHLPDRRPGI